MRKIKAIVLNGQRTKDPEINNLYMTITEALANKGFDTNSIPLNQMKISACQGCFDCWVKTPGICKIEDDGREITKEIVQSDVVLHFTPITFGGYSSELKKAIDRSIPVLLPFFKKINGEIHHKQRYERIASKIIVGYLNKQDERKENIFRKLTYRNYLNMQGPIYETLIYVKGDNLPDFQQKLNNILEEVKKKHE